MSSQAKALVRERFKRAYRRKRWHLEASVPMHLHEILVPPAGTVLGHGTSPSAAWADALHTVQVEDLADILLGDKR